MTANYSGAETHCIGENAELLSVNNENHFNSIINLFDIGEFKSLTSIISWHYYIIQLGAIFGDE